MPNAFSPSMFLPYTLFETKKRFDDTDADDMQCGDMGDAELLALGLNDISAKVDPYRLIRYDFPWMPYQGGIFSPPAPGIKISHEECVDILFTEMKELAQMFSFQGEYKTLIGEMIDHFRYGTGRRFYSQRLNAAFHKRINSYDVDNPLFLIRDAIKKEFYLNSRSTYYPALLCSIKTRLSKSHLPKFNSIEDRINGLGISVHDISAQKIALINLQRYARRWSATVSFNAQDHFGLDVTDIQNRIYREFRFFRIWFFLQRHRDFAFKPFFTNFRSVEKIGEN